MLPQNENLRLCAVEELAHDNEVAIGELENDVTALDEDLDEVKEDIEALNEAVEGIPIVAAVTPAASAANLPGLKIGDTAYKIPEGGGSNHLYRHNIVITYRDSSIGFTVYNNSNAVFTHQILDDYLTANAGTDIRHIVSVCGKDRDSV